MSVYRNIIFKKINNGDLHLHNQQINNLKRVTKERHYLTRRWGKWRKYLAVRYSILSI